MKKIELSQIPHRRKNILTGEWVLVSPHRTSRPWQGALSAPANEIRPAYVPDCYLCPGNKRANGEVNPRYTGTFVFTNDFAALLDDIPPVKQNRNNLLHMKSERGICRVVNFSPRHDLTLAEMQEGDIEEVISAWQHEFRSLGAHPHVNYVQIFENKGPLMGNSNPHPHGQIWAQESIPMEPMKELKQFKLYYAKNKRSLLADYLKLEMKLNERVVYENKSFVVLVPFWAVWPYETMIISKRRISTLLQLKDAEKKEFANVLSVVTVKYDNLFKTSFPYSAGMHQAPTDGKDHREWHFHMHFYPPLLRSSSIKKFMVGYEMLAEPQRDITPEYSAGILRDLSAVRF
ncbi:MAG: UDP-glucose--hexose-1-phosphate uridylyltransferase [Ignavibacteriae bacterium]|nr:MAG: UDP-glucose--hexose-1-phosphate uridylyltransferase [Ignavibacteriota bacterium]